MRILSASGSGPSEAELTKAFLAAEARSAAVALARLDEEELAGLWEGLFDLPSRHLGLLVALPELLFPELDRLCQAVAADDPEQASAALRPVLGCYATHRCALGSPGRPSPT